MLTRHRVEQRILILEIAVYRPLGHAGPLGDVLQPGGGVATFDKQGQGGSEQFSGTCVLAPLPVVLGAAGLFRRGGAGGHGKAIGWVGSQDDGVYGVGAACRLARKRWYSAEARSAVRPASCSWLTCHGKMVNAVGTCSSAERSEASFTSRRLTLMMWISASAANGLSSLPRTASSSWRQRWELSLIAASVSPVAREPAPNTSELSTWPVPGTWSLRSMRSPMSRSELTLTSTILCTEPCDKCWKLASSEPPATARTSRPRTPRLSIRPPSTRCR